ncbi:MAG: hypothetical protein AVDCRST_MAG38-34, partial [uncultured Solirubrobacteraceae bacterium]
GPRDPLRPAQPARHRGRRRARPLPRRSQRRARRLRVPRLRPPGAERRV